MSKKPQFDQKDYDAFLASIKEMDMPVAVSAEKENHPSSLYVEIPINALYEFGDCRFSCEVRNKDANNYSLQLLTDVIGDRVVCRLDEGNGTHRNRFKDIPLEHQSVPTPHIHQYDQRGRWMAYPLIEVSTSMPLSIQCAFKYFCNKYAIRSVGGAYDIVVGEQNSPLFPVEDDPLNGINFT